MEARREAMMKRLASRHEERILKTVEVTAQKKIDLRATEKAFLESSPSAVDMKTPIHPIGQIKELETSSPILSFDEEADKQMGAFAAWCNTIIGLESTEELDLGATKADACKKIQMMLKKKVDIVVEEPQKQRARRYHRIFEKNDPVKMAKQCRLLLADCGVDESLKELLKKNMISIRSELAVYSDLALQTSLLRVFFSFHPAWLKTALEAIFSTHIDIAPNNLVCTISKFFIDHVFSDQKMLKNKKFAQGSGKPIVTPAGKVALHNHFLLVSMKIMFLIETAHQKGTIPNLTRIFNKSSVFKSMDDVFAELTKELLSGSSMSMKKAFAKIGFTSSYEQSFIENYEYRVEGFESFSDGLVLAKLVETVGELPRGELLLKLRDPAGDRIRKINNVKTVMNKMNELGIVTEDVLPTSIVGGKKEAILSVLWSIIGVRVAKEKRIRMPRVHEEEEREDNDENRKEGREKRRRSAMHDDMSREVLETCKSYGRQLDEPVPDLASLGNGVLLSKAWSAYVPSAPSVDSFPGDSLWQRVVKMAEEELQIPIGLHLNTVIFVKTFLERMQEVRMFTDKATTIQKAWRSYAYRKKTPKLYYIVRQILDSPLRSVSPRLSVNNSTFTVPQTPTSTTFTVPRTPMNRTIDRSSISSMTNDATFTMERCSIDRLRNVFRIPNTPARMASRSTSVFSEVIVEEDGEEEDFTIVASVSKKRTKIVYHEEQVAKLDEETSEVNNETAENGLPNPEPSEPSESQEMKTEPPATPEDVVCSESTETPEDFVCSEPPATQEDVVCSEPPATQGDVVYSESATTQEDVVCSEPPCKEADKQEEPEEIEEVEEVETDAIVLRNREFVNSIETMEIDLLTALPSTDHVTADIENDQSTPELRRIFRKAMELKRKQQDVPLQARKLGHLERFASSKLTEMAFIESNDDDRSMAGFDEGNDVIVLDGLMTESPNHRFEVENEAAVLIQKTVRGFLARRRFHAEIKAIRSRAAEYNQILAHEDEAFATEQQPAGRTAETTTTAQMKLKKCTLHGLTNDNLHIVNLAATIIDRLTDLVPSLLDMFVVELDGLKLVYNILEVADRGYSYTSILHPLLRILEKSFVCVSAEKSNDNVAPLLVKLTPRLSHLLLAHCANETFFRPLATSLLSIARRFPKKQSHMDKSVYFVKKAQLKVTNAKSKKMLSELETVCSRHV